MLLHHLYAKCRNAVAGMLLFIGSVAQAQTSQFLFDSRGNLLAQKAEMSVPPQIIGQPQNQIIEPGNFTTFAVVAANTRSLAYQWRFNGANLPGANSDTLLLTNVNADKEGEYRVVLTNPSGSVTSAPAFLMLDSDADGLADSWEMAHFGTLNQYANGDFDGDGASNLQEFQDGSLPTSSSSVNYRLLVIRDGGSVVKTPDKTHYTNGESVTLTATALAGQELFHAWMGDILTRTNPVTLVMTNNKTVIARFTPILFTFTNVSGGDWNIGANWSPNLAPGSNDSVVIPNSTVTLNSPANCVDVTLNAGTLTGSGTLTVWKHFAWNSGAMAGSGRTMLDAHCTLEIQTASVSLNSRTLENAGTIRLSGSGEIAVTGGAVIANQPGALFLVQNAPAVGSVFANGRLDNAGTFRKEGSTGSAIFNNGMLFNNSGVVDLQSGILSLGGGGTNAGTFIAAASTIVAWTGGSFALNPGGQLNGDGFYRINAGTVTANTNVAIQNFEMINGTLEGVGMVTVSSLMNWNGGTMSGNGRTTIPGGGILNLATSSTVGLNARTLENSGTILWTGAGFIGMNFGGVISNRAGGLFHILNAASLSSGSGDNRFDNAGTFRKSSNTDTTTVNSVFNNSGTVEIEAGTLLCNASFTNLGVVRLSGGTTHRMAGGGSATGTFETPGAAQVEWTGRSFSLNPGAQLNGPGFYRINGNSANVAVNADVSVQNFDLANGDSTLGALSGAGSLTINHAMNWAGGSMSGTGRTIISKEARLSVDNANTIGLLRILENAGTVAWAGPGIMGLRNGVITNRVGGVFEALNAGRIAFSGGSCRIDNLGTFRKSGTAGTMSIDAGLPFNNSGTVDLRSGILAANGGYTSTSNALLNCALGGTTPGAGYGQLQVAGNSTLGGGLGVEFLNDFLPTTNDSFTVVTASARNGAFTRFSYPSNVVTMELSNTANSVIVRATGAAIPELVLLPPVITSSIVTLCWTGQPDKTYRLEFSPDLGSANWSPVPGDVVALGNKSCLSDTLTASNRFYRVRVLP